jgi:hypothetical protein
MYCFVNKGQTSVKSNNVLKNKAQNQTGAYGTENPIVIIPHPLTTTISTQPHPDPLPQTAPGLNTIVV